jgi:hypothetical protein
MPTDDSATDLTVALRRAADAHRRHAEESGHPDPDWPDWYPQQMEQGQAGRSGHASPGAST